MKGRIVKTEQGWFVRYRETTPLSITTETLPLHPADVEQINKDSQVFDNIEARIASYPEVEFEMVRYIDKCQGLTINDMCFMDTPSVECGCANTYAKLLHHSVESNEMIDHIGDANKMVEDDVEKLAEGFYPLNDDLYPNSSLIRKAFTAGYNKAKETLYTEEQVREAIYKARDIKFVTFSDDEIVESLKQPKQ